MLPNGFGFSKFGIYPVKSTTVSSIVQSSIFFFFSVPIKVQYDKSFQTAWGDKALFAVRGFLAIVQNIYRWSTWKVKMEFVLPSEISYNSKESFAQTRFFKPDGKYKIEEL